MPPPTVERARLIAEVLAFVRAVQCLPGITRITLIGSLPTNKADPKDVDLLVTVADDTDLAPLASLTRKLQGHAQQMNRAGRLTEAEYLKRMQDILEQVQQGTARNIPARLHRYQHAQAYFGVLQNVLETSPGSLANGIAEDVLADMAIEIEKLIEGQKIRDWVTNRDAQKAMMNDIEDYLYAIKAQYSLPLAEVEMDLLLEQVLEVAKQRDRL